MLQYLFDQIQEVLIENKVVMLAAFFFYVLELFLSRKAYADQKEKTTSLNLKYFVFGLIINKPLNFVARAVLTSAFVRYLQTEWGFVSFFTNANLWVSLIGILIIHDFLTFNVHYLVHKVDFLWRFHKCHHSIRHVNVTAVWREHFGEGVIFLFLVEIPLILLGFNANAMIFKNFVAEAFNFITHFDFKFNQPWLSRYFITPHTHLWHHAAETKTKNNHQNLANVFAVWDHLYGTYYYSEEFPKEVGIANDPNYPETLFGQLLHPIYRK